MNKCEWCPIVGTALFRNGYRKHHVEMRQDEWGNKLGIHM